MRLGNKQYNRELLKLILEKDPKTRFVFFRRYGDSFIGDFVDIPAKQAESIIKRYPEWKIITEGIKNEKIVQFKKENFLEIPPRALSISKKEFNRIMNIEKSKRANKFVYIKSSTGKIVDIPLKDLAVTLKQPGTALISEEVSTKSIEAPVIDKNPLECPICGFIARSISGLKIHNKKHR